MGALRVRGIAYIVLRRNFLRSGAVLSGSLSGQKHVVLHGLVDGGGKFGLGGCGQGGLFCGLRVGITVGNIGAASGVAAVADLRGGLFGLLNAQPLAAGGPVGFFKGGAALLLLLLFSGLNFLFAGVQVLFGLALGTKALGFKALFLKLLLPGAALGLADGVCFL